MDSKSKKRLAKEYVQELASDIMLELTDEEIESILEVEHQIRQKFEKVTKIETQNVEPIYYPLEQAHHFLRDDKVSQTLDQKNVLKNAPAVEGDLILITKVVK